MAADELHQLDDAAAALWSIPAHRMKARRDHLVPLPPLAREIVVIRSWRARPDDRTVFTPRSGARPPRASLARILADLIEGLDGAGGADADVIARLKADRPTAHDLRRTVATNLSKLGIPREDRLSVLGHSPSDVHGQVYDHFDRLPQKRAALERWQDHVRRVIARR
jgi:integrase